MRKKSRHTLSKRIFSRVRKFDQVFMDAGKASTNLQRLHTWSPYMKVEDVGLGRLFQGKRLPQNIFIIFSIWLQFAKITPHPVWQDFVVPDNYYWRLDKS